MSTTELPKVSEIMFKYLEMSTPSVQIKQDLQEIFISMKQQINILDMALKSPQNQDFFTLFNLGFSHISKLLMYCYIITKYLNQSSIPIIKEKIVNSRPYIKKYCFYCKKMNKFIPCDMCNTAACIDCGVITQDSQLLHKKCYTKKLRASDKYD